MILRIWQLAALMLLCMSVLGCGDSDCPTCESESEVTVWCSVAYTPDAFSSGRGSFAINASIIGDPVPQEISVSCFDSSLFLSDGINFPSFWGGVDTVYTKHVLVSMIIDGDSIEVETTIPEPTEFVVWPSSPLANEPLEVMWSRSQDADEYYLSAYVWNPAQGFSFSIDTLFSGSDTAFTIAGEYIKEGYTVAIWVNARSGTSGTAGDVANFHSGRFTGFLSGYYHAGPLGLTIYPNTQRTVLSHPRR